MYNRGYVIRQESSRVSTFRFQRVLSFFLPWDVDLYFRVGSECFSYGALGLGLARLGTVRYSNVTR